MISQFKEGDEFVWIPVSKESDQHSERAFLPVPGIEEYLYGYKAEISKATYFTALSNIQHAFINNESNVFTVNNGTRNERQYKAKWRDGRQKNSPLLGPTKGWVKVPIGEITKLSDTDLALALEKSETQFAEIMPVTTSIKPTICYTDEELTEESEKLRQLIGNRTPEGQSNPSKRSSTRDVFARDAAVVAYVLEKSDGMCECCGNKAPFYKENGVPFLEVHHVRHLSDDGKDKITNAVAVCPNCHRELHHGVNKKSLADALYSNVGRLIRD